MGQDRPSNASLIVTKKRLCHDCVTLGLLFPNPVGITLFTNQEQAMPFSCVNGERLVNVPTEDSRP
jgi:hypothetical protein